MKIVITILVKELNATLTLHNKINSASVTQESVIQIVSMNPINHNDSVHY